MSTLPKSRLTPAEYLERERKSEIRSEYLRGAMVAIPRANRMHCLIKGNVAASLHSQLLDVPREVYAAMRVKVNATGLYTYPDVVVACGNPQFEDAEVDTLLNPILIVEVLSKSTEAYDRGGKWAHYRAIPSLSDYVLVSTSEPRLELFTRQPGDHWLLTCVNKPEESLEIPGVDCRLNVEEVYRKVTFDSADE